MIDRAAPLIVAVRDVTVPLESTSARVFEVTLPAVDVEVPDE